MNDIPGGTPGDSGPTHQRSARKARMYEPGVFIDRVSPTPLLMIVGRQDTVTLTDTGLAAYSRAGTSRRTPPSSPEPRRRPPPSSATI
ncbi:alpha/beta hydrolase [Streptomyces endocoffeicus]|uniref:alpha/beta hydrolase n=1 Tax=Streptomyces endocoffeicus TaxID=2898945 RepID=UPI001E48AC50|nr:alpha/beta hydrolase [Streptomyces endocoffeicus]